MKKKIAIITTPIVCAVITFIIVLNSVIIPNIKYHSAEALMDTEKYDEAIKAFAELGEYKDSKNKILDIKYDKAVKLINSGEYETAYMLLKDLAYKDSDSKAVVAKMKQLKNVYVGDYVNFGAYEQDNNTLNGKEDIEWLVLGKQDNKLLIISKYALDAKPYNKNADWDRNVWETCPLRSWLNTEFINIAFSEEEKSLIPIITVPGESNPPNSTTPENATEDQVFLLSIDEINKYFSSNSATQCKPTDYAIANGVRVNTNNGNCWYWLRSSGVALGYTACINYDGSIQISGYDNSLDYITVRPALFIDLNLVRKMYW